MPSLENYIQKIHKKLNNEGLEERKVNLSLCILLPACCGFSRIVLIPVPKYASYFSCKISDLAKTYTILNCLP